MNVNVKGLGSPVRGTVSSKAQKRKDPLSKFKELQKLDSFVAFKNDGGELYEDHGVFRMPFSDRYTEVSPDTALNLLQDGVDGNLLGKSKDEKAKFGLDNQEDFAVFDSIYLDGSPDKAEDSKTANALKNLRSSGETFAEYGYDGTPVSAKGVYDSFVHGTSSGLIFKAVSNGDEENRYYLSEKRDIGIHDFFNRTGDPKSIDNPEVAALLKEAGNDGSLGWNPNSARVYKNFMNGGNRVQFSFERINTVMAQGGDIKSLAQAHDKALEEASLIKETIWKEVDLGNIGESSAGRVYKDVLNSDVPGTMREERFEAFTNLNTALLKANDEHKFNFLHRTNASALGIYNSLEDTTPSDQFLQTVSGVAGAVEKANGS